jgi:hypothetical protein
MYLIGARKQDLVYAAVLDAILLLITVLVGFFRYSSKVKALSNALKRPLEEQAQLPEATDDVEILYHRLLENQSIARSESESSAAIRQSQMRDYYSMWVHQIKTPISAMKLQLCRQFFIYSRWLMYAIGLLTVITDRFIPQTYTRLQHAL